MGTPLATTGRLTSIRRGEPLPDATVEAADGTAAPLRIPGKVVALLVRHSDCDLCDAYTKALQDARRDIESWDARLVVTRGPAARLLIADQHALVHELTEDHAFPAPEAVEESVKFLATQCPECGGPEGGWAELATESGY